MPGENHWELIDTALITHHQAGAAQLWELDDTGFATAQKVAAFGGNNTSGPSFATVEMIDYQDANPQWQRHEDLLLPVQNNYAAVLPDGKVLIVGGEVDDDRSPRVRRRRAFTTKCSTRKRGHHGAR